MEEIYGKQVLPALAEQFRQLYLLPGRDAPLYKKALQGQTPTGADLSHFVMDDRDSIIIEDTPAGSVPVVTLHDRSAFETFLRCMVYRCELADIPASQGAAMISGIIDRQKIAALREGYLKEHPGDMMGWIRRFEEIRTDKRAVTSDMVVLSYGAYSGFVPEGHTEDEWLSLSMTIRKYHECTHFIVHRLYHHEKDGLFDELMADTVGIYAALGRYDMPLLERCLGIADGIYIGGRLSIYAEPSADTIGYIHDTLERISRIPSQPSPYDLIPVIEDMRDIWGCKKTP